jgi:16S rRNA (guanine527-N7)-methyltransferase
MQIEKHDPMHIGSVKWIDQVVNGAAGLKVAVTAVQAGLFAEHATALLEWNRKINLTAITDPFEVAIKHFVDAVAPLNYIAPDAHVLDIGTGGGFPAIPLKILRPRQPMTLVDASRKKINFIKHLIRKLQLTRIAPLHARAQDLARDPDHSRHYQVIICRALAELPVIMDLASPLLAENGRIIAMKGPQEPAGCPDADEMQLAGYRVPTREHGNEKPTNSLAFPRSAWECMVGNAHPTRFQVRTITYQLPVLGDQRRLVIIDAQSDEQ